MKYAVIEACGKQYFVEEGQILDIEKTEGEKGQEIIFKEVLLVVEDDKASIGKPIIEGKTVTAEIVEQYKDKKIYIYKYKSKSRYRRKTGHRQEKTRVMIKKIN